MFDPLSEYALDKVTVSQDIREARTLSEEMTVSKSAESRSQGVEGQSEQHCGLEPRLPVRAVDLRVADSGHRRNGILETGTCPSQAPLPRIIIP